jgi:hypothetical protein
MISDFGEPWHYDSDQQRVVDQHGQSVCGYSSDPMRRMVACVNACAGIPTERLSQFGATLRRCEELRKDWDWSSQDLSPSQRARLETLIFGAQLGPDGDPLPDFVMKDLK